MGDALSSTPGTDAVEFEYRLVGTGWSEARLAVGAAWTELTASYLGDALGDLLAAVALLAQEEGEARFSWEEEPGEFRWVVSRAGQTATVRVLWFDDQFPSRPDEQGQVRLDARCDFDALMAAVATAARAVLDEYGEKGYEAKWVEHPFPLGDLLALERLARR